MLKREYRFKFYLNARHTMNLQDKNAKIHPHTWEFVIYLQKFGDDFVQFTDIEREIQAHLSKYENTLLNKVPPFDRINPILENIGEVIFEQISGILHKRGWRLEKLEVSENPTRTYIISGDIEMSGDVEGNNCEDIYPSVPATLPDEEALEDKAGHEEIVADDSDIKSDTEARDNGKIIEIDNGGEEAKEQYAAVEQDTAVEKDATVEQNIAIEQDAAGEQDAGEFSAIKNYAVKYKYILLSSLLIAVSSIITILLITRSGVYPWGSDTWGHLYKARLLYDEVRAGNYYPLYSDDWYNGTQPFRYWAPLPYYIMAVFLFLTGGNIILMYNIFIVFIFIVGAVGWTLWGAKTGRRILAPVLGVLWFFIPDNLRVLFSEGNIPRVIITALFPYLLMGSWDYLERRNKKSLILIYICVILTTLNHAMISAMACISIFIYVLWYRAANRKGSVSGIFLTLILGIASSGVWLFPALKGGIFSLSEEAMIEAVKMQTYSMFESLNPLLRFTVNKEAFYFGLSIILISLFGLFFCDRKNKAGFGITILIFLGTTKTLFPIIVKLPMSQVLWMWRFTPLAMAFFLSGLLLWKKIKKEVLAVLLAMVIVDCVSTFSLLGHGVQMTEKHKDFDIALSRASQRIATIDISQFGSFPSYYISYNEVKSLNQVFGWASQGANTMPNLVWLNTAAEKGWYSFLFDRCLELGADTLVVKKDVIKDIDRFISEANSQGYEAIGEEKNSITLKYPIDYSFATKASYTGLGIGRYASNIAFIFPMFQVGNSIYLDDYTEEELLGYKVVYLSGFKYRDKAKAENMVIKLSQKGVRFVIDMTGTEVDVYTSRSSFLDVISQPVKFIAHYPMLKINGREYDLGEMPEDNYEWRTIYLENLDNVYGSAFFNNQGMNFWGTKFDENIIFIGFNIPYFAVETKDAKAVDILEEITGITAYETPERQIVKINIISNTNSIKIKSEEEGAISAIAYLDAFKFTKGEAGRLHNLVLMKDRELEIMVAYPFLLQGLTISLVGLSGFIIFYVVKREEGVPYQSAVYS